jgi:hypothetical protein
LLIQSCRIKVAKFKEYYKEYGEDYKVITTDISKPTIYHGIDSFRNNIDKISLSNPNFIFIMLDLKYFIKSLNEEKSDGGYLSLTLGPLNYQIGVDNQSHNRKYHQLLNDNEINELANQFAKNRLQKVKQFIEELKNKQS